MQLFLPFFLVLFAGVFFSTVFRRMHLPYVVALIVGGILIGPHVLGILELNETVTFIGDIGLVFLMFMAGLETRLGSLKNLKGKLLFLSFLNGYIPFALGIMIGFWFGYDTITTILIGTIFISSSIAVIVPSLEQNGLLNKPLGRSILSITIIQDVASLVLLSIVFQNINPTTPLPLPLFYLLLVVSLVIFRMAFPVLHRMTHNLYSSESAGYEKELHVIFVILIGTVVVFELLGLHAIIAGFFAGLVLSDSIQSNIIKNKLRTISYGLFIPVFFVVVGSETDMTVFLKAGQAWYLTIAIVIGSMLSKIVSGTLGAWVMGYTKNESRLFGFASVPQLSTTLAVAFIARSFDIFDDKLLTAVIMLSIVTTLFAPIMVGRAIKRLPPSKK